MTYLGTKMPSFRDAHEALNQLLRTTISLKRVERQTERIGAERVAQRAAEIMAWIGLPLVSPQSVSRRSKCASSVSTPTR